MRVFAAALLCPPMLLSTGCQGLDAANGLNLAEVRFVDLSTSSPNLDFYIGNTAAAYNLGASTSTTYVPVAPGMYTLNANRASTSQALVTARASMSAPHRYTVVVSHSLANMQEHIFQDQDTPAPAGQIAVRVVQEAEPEVSLDVYLVPAGTPVANATPLSNALGPGTASSYIDIPASTTYTVAVAPGGISAAHAFPIPDITIKAPSGAVRTVVLTGSRPGLGSLSALVLNDLDTP